MRCRWASTTPRRVRAAAMMADVARTAAPRTSHSSKPNCRPALLRAHDQQVDDDHGGGGEQGELEAQSQAAGAQPAGRPA